MIHWLWRLAEDPVGGQSGNDMQRILILGETWVSIDSSYRSVKAVAADRQGDVYSAIRFPGALPFGFGGDGCCLLLRTPLLRRFGGS